jgi:hypothetical protein
MSESPFANILYQYPRPSGRGFKIKKEKMALAMNIYWMGLKPNLLVQIYSPT